MAQTCKILFLNKNWLQVTMEMQHCKSDLWTIYSGLCHRLEWPRNLFGDDFKSCMAVLVLSCAEAITQTVHRASQPTPETAVYYGGSNHSTKMNQFIRINLHVGELNPVIDRTWRHKSVARCRKKILLLLLYSASLETQHL